MLPGKKGLSARAVATEINEVEDAETINERDKSWFRSFKEGDSRQEDKPMTPKLLMW